MILASPTKIGPQGLATKWWQVWRCLQPNVNTVLRRLWTCWYILSTNLALVAFWIAGLFWMFSTILPRKTTQNPFEKKFGPFEFVGSSWNIAVSSCTLIAKQTAIVSKTFLFCSKLIYPRIIVVWFQGPSLPELASRFSGHDGAHYTLITLGPYSVNDK